MKLFSVALEDTGLNQDNEPILPTNVDEDAACEFDVTDDESGLTAVVGKQIDVLRDFDRIDDALISTNQLSGISENTAQALQVAVESMCSAVGVEYKSVEFEPQSSYRARRKNVTVAVESFKEAAKAVWMKVVELLKRFVAWLKRTFALRRAKNASVQAKANRLTDKVRAAQENKDPAAPAVSRVIDPANFIDPVLVTRLNVKGSVPQNVELVRAANDHFAQMRNFYQAGLVYSNIIVGELEQCLDAVNKDGSEFNDKISTVLGQLLSRSIITRVCPKPNRTFSKGVLLYEEPLVFGHRSYYRSSSNSASDITMDDIVSEVAESSSIVRVDPNQKLYALELTHSEVLSKNIQAHVRMIGNWIDQFDRIVERTDRISARASKLDSRPDADARSIERSARRARQITRAFNIFMRQYNSLAGSMISYDHMVCDSLLTYSLKAM